MTPEEVLNRHELAPWSDNYDWHCSPECGESGSMREGESHAEHVLAALGVAGYAITKLPEPDEFGDWRSDHWDVMKPLHFRSFGMIRFDIGVDASKLTAADTRDFAAALLAAAAAAEENQP